MADTGRRGFLARICLTVGAWLLPGAHFRALADQPSPESTFTSGDNLRAQDAPPTPGTPAMAGSNAQPSQFKLEFPLADDPPSPLPTGVQPLLLEENRPPINIDDDSYVEISERPGMTPIIPAVGPGYTKINIPRFNTLDDATTRELIISGVEVRFDGSSSKLTQLEENPISDLTKVTIYADQVLIAKTLRWQGTDVWIYARKLTFRDNGCINTSPQEWGTQQAFSVRQRNGRPIDDQGKYTNKGQDGQPGQRAGNLYLFVQEADFGVQDGNRFVCKGSDGQVGEPGGLKLNEDKDGKPIAPKNKTPVTRQDILNVLQNSAYSTSDLNDESHWWYPTSDGGSTRNFVGMDGTFLSSLDRGIVTDVQVVLVYAAGLDVRNHVVQIPGYKDSWLSAGQGLPLSYKDRTLPGVGEDAYPSGTTGKGGDGGWVYWGSFWKVSGHMGGMFEQGRSTPSVDVNGGEPGTPQNAIYCNLVLFQYPTWFNSAPRPSFKCSSWESGRGTPAQGTAAGAGTPGSFRVWGNGPVHNNDWLQAEVLRPVLAFAETAYRNGFRDQARELLTPYLEALKAIPPEKLSADVIICRHRLLDLCRNLYTADLDLYGHSPGWVPRFSATTYLQLYDIDRGFSYKFCYIMTKLLQVMDDVEHAGTVLEATAGQAEAAINVAHLELGEGYKRYASARDTMDEAVQLYQQVQTDLQHLQKDAENTGREAEKQKAIATAILAGLGSVAKAIPVYKPAFQIAGELLTKAGEAVDNIDPSEPDPSVNALNFLQGFSKKAADTLQTNADTFKDQFDATLKAKYKTDPAKESLKTKIDKATNEVKGLEDQHAGAIKAVNKDQKLADDLKPAEAVITELRTSNADLKGKIADYDTLIAAAEAPDAVTPPPRSSASEIASKQRQLMVARRSRLATCLALNAENIGRLRSKQQALVRNTAGAATGKDNTDADVTTAEDRQDKLRKAKKTLDDLLKEQNEADVDTKIGNANKTFGNVMDGAQSLLTGMATVSTSINRLKTLNKPNAEPDAQITKLRDLYLKNNAHFKDLYKTALDNLQIAEQKKGNAISSFQACNDFVLKRTADLSQALHTRVGVARNRLSLALSLDAGLKTAIRDMQRSASERMEYYLYLFRKAYMYEQLAPVSDQMANINKLVQQLDEQLDGLKGDQDKNLVPKDMANRLAFISKLTNDKFGQLGDMALTNTLADLGREILDRRTTTGSTKIQTYPSLPLSQHVLTSLNERNTYTFPGVNILIGESGADPAHPKPPIELEGELASNPRVVISNITLMKEGEDLEFNCPPGFNGPFKIHMAFGRQFVLRAPGADGKYYLFRIAEDETPITYEFTVSKFTSSKDNSTLKTGTVTPATVELVDKLFNLVINKVNEGKEKEQKVDYAEMSPSLYSSLTITVAANQPITFKKLSPSFEIRYD